jgi:hypothetical protein
MYFAHWALRALALLLRVDDRGGAAGAARLFTAFVKDPQYAPEREVRFVMESTSFDPPQCERREDGRRFIELTYNPTIQHYITQDHTWAPGNLPWTKVVYATAPIPFALMVCGDPDSNLVRSKALALQIL